MKKPLTRWLEAVDLPHSAPMYLLVVPALIVLTSICVHFLRRRIVLPLPDRQASLTDRDEPDSAAQPAARRRVPVPRILPCLVASAFSADTIDGPPQAFATETLESRTYAQAQSVKDFGKSYEWRHGGDMPEDSPTAR